VKVASASRSVNKTQTSFFKPNHSSITHPGKSGLARSSTYANCCRLYGCERV